MKTKILITAFLFVSVSVSALSIAVVTANYVYKNGKWCFGNNIGKEYWYEPLKEVIGADILTFEVLNCSDKYGFYANCFYAKDKNYVYHKGEIIEGANPDNFIVILSEVSYSKDNESVYFESKKIEGADLQTFELVNSVYIYLFSYAKDKNSIFKNGVRMAYDVSTFRLLVEQPPYTIDKSGIYFNDSLLKGSLSEDYRILKNTIYHQYAAREYLISNNKVFYQENEIKDADATTFQVVINKHTSGDYFSCSVDYMIAKDKNYIYLNGQIMTKIDVKTFEIVDINDIEDQDGGSPFWTSIGDAIIKDKNGTYRIKKESDKFVLIPIKK